MLKAGLPFLEALCALVGMIAVLMLLIGLLHTVSAVRSSNSHLEWYRFGGAKQAFSVLLDAGPAKEPAAGRSPSKLDAYSLITWSQWRESSR